MTPVPEGLSAAYEGFWRILLAGRDFSEDSAELLARSLRRFTLSDELLGLARQAGLGTPAGLRLLGAARDAEMLGLKLWVATGLDKADTEALGRPGRPPGGFWRGRVSPQPRDHLTGRPLRGKDLA